MNKKSINRIRQTLPQNTLEWPDIAWFKEETKLIMKNIKKENFLKDIDFVFDNYPSKEILFNFKVEDRYDLLSLYERHPFGQNDKIFLFRCPIIKYAVSDKQNIKIVIKNVIKFEIKHHLKNSYIY